MFENTKPFSNLSYYFSILKLSNQKSNAIMKSTIKIILLGQVLVILLSCAKNNNDWKDYTDSLDITEFIWRLEHLKINGDIKAHETEYILHINNDSLFMMNFSVNGAGGFYKIIENGKIEFWNYHAFTEMCCDNEFDAKLSTTLIKTKAYKVLGNDLIIFGDSEELMFMKL